MRGSAKHHGDGSLKVAFVVDGFPSLSETFVLNQITGLLERGHEVDIFATKRPTLKAVHPDVARYDLLGRTRYITPASSRLIRVLQGAAMLLAHAPRHTRLLGAVNVFRYGRAALGFQLVYAAVPFLSPYDIVHCQYGTNGEAVGALLKELGLQRRLVTTFHGYDIRLAEQRGVSPFRRLLREGDCFLAISEYSRTRLLELGVAPTRVVYHPVGIDGQVFRARPSSAEAVGDEVGVVTVARLVPEKGLDTAIRAIALVLRQRPELRLRYEIVGGGPEYEGLGRLITTLGLQGIVRLHGPRPQDGVLEVLRRNHIFVLSSRAEVLPVALMEAHALGLPAIAPAVGGIGEIVQEGISGFLVRAGDIEATATRLRQLIEQPKLRVEMGEAGRRHVLAHFDVNVLNDRLVEIYRQVLDQPAGVARRRRRGEGLDGQVAAAAEP